jgi:predicted esterase
MGIALCLTQVSFTGFGQTISLVANTHVETSTNTTCNGYFLYLPQGYTTSKKYPIIIAFHGSGEDGNGSAGALANLQANGLPKAASKAGFPTSFTVNGVTSQFIIFAPQFLGNPEYYDVDSVFNYALSHFSVDINRVYMTGYSQGGGNIWYWGGSSTLRASEAAGLFPIAGSVQIPQSFAQTMATAQLPVAAATNVSDPTVNPSISITNVNEINASNPAPNPAAYLKIFQASGHGGWDSAYNPASLVFNGMNLYTYMLQYQRSFAAALPVVLGDYTARLTAPSAVTISWTTTSEINNKYFQIERSADGINFTAIGTVAAANVISGYSYSFVDPAPLKGINYYRLSQIDADGKMTYFNVLSVTVTTTLTQGLRMSPNPVTGAIQLVLTHPETGKLSVLLYDMQGRMLRSWQFDKEIAVWQQTIDVGNIAPGAYTIQIKGNTIREVQQFVKQ